MSEMTSLAEAWKKRLRELEAYCPWPGPRPLSLELDRDKFWRFVGRKNEVRSFLQMLDEHSLLVLHGVSGAGKSTLLDMGLVTIMRQRRYFPIICRGWQKMAGESPAGFIRSVVQAQPWLPDAIRVQLRDSDDPVAVLDDALAGRAVLVLDQFEELIRYQREDFRAMAEWLLSVNKTRRTRVVLSLRSEYVFELADMLAEARPFTTAYLPLAPVSSDAEIRQVIAGPNRDGVEAISGPAAGRLFSLWAELPAEKPVHSLLYLHALLFSLYWRAEGKTVDLDLVESVVESARQRLGRTGQEQSAGEVAETVFSSGFDQAIERKLEMCRRAYLDLAPERAFVLPTAAVEQVRLLVPHLSSGGYKLERDLLDLFRVASARELELLCYDAAVDVDRPVGQLSVTEAERLLTWAIDEEVGVDLLTAGRKGFLRGAGVDAPLPPPAPHEEELADLGVAPVPWRNDPSDATAGALLGFAPWEVLVEQIRAFAFAIAWLRETALIRVSAPAAGKPMAHLIHDGMGAALKQWSDRHGFTPRTAAHALCAFEGERWAWLGDGGNYFDKVSAAGEPQWRYLANLRWRYCQISADFRRTVFVNCDFRGARFQGSRFEGVTFINCLLDSVVLEACTVVGTAPGHNPAIPAYATEQITGVNADALPPFVVHNVSELLIREWNAYRETSVDATNGRLYSPTSGVAAVPWTGSVDEVDWQEHSGGIAMYGGRLSSLMIRDCDFSQGSMTLAYVAGSSLDVVETTSLDLVISWSAVRGFSVTRRPSAGEDLNWSDIKVAAQECVLYSSWLGTDLQGDVSISDCQVFAITNLSPDLRVRLSDSMLSQDLGVWSDLPPKSRSEMLSWLTANAPRTTYRSVPAKVEFERRVGQATGGETPSAAGSGAPIEQ